MHAEECEASFSSHFPCLPEGFNKALSFDRGERGAYLKKRLFLWRAEGDLLSPAIVQKEDASSQNWEVVSLEDRYQFGGSFAGGYHFAHGDWRAGLQYTYFGSRTSSPGTEISSSEGEIVPLWAADQRAGGPYFSEEARWTLYRHLIDLDLSRRYYVGQLLAVSAQVGLRAILFSQKYQAEYGNATTSLTTQTQTDSWSLGPRLQLSSSWFIGSGLELFFDIASTLSYVDCDAHHQEEDPLGSYELQLNAKDVRVCPTQEMSAGIGWGASFLRHAFHLHVTLEYTLEALYGQNVLRSFLEPIVVNFSRGSDDLTLQGFTLSVRSDF
ncbi:MAG: Lpg1974 family pore-forming outer membrane protein [Chlamydiota bacterium]